MKLSASVSTPILAAFLLLALVITGNAVVGLWGVRQLSEMSRRVGSALAPQSQVAMQVVVHSSKAGEARSAGVSGCRHALHSVAFPASRP